MANPIDGLKQAEPAKQYKSSKIAVVYMDGDKGPFRCDHCEYYIKENGCKIVEGFIDPAGCCNLYEPPDEDD